MKKKIALALVIFFLGSLCIYADEDIDYSDKRIAIASIVFSTVIGFSALLIAFHYYNIGENEKGDAILEAWLDSINKDKKNLHQNYPRVNPVLNHTQIDLYPNGKVFIGFKYSW
jgi:hypothetical protein